MNFDKKPFHLILGDCIEVLKTLPENSVDALVSDPPYGWRFMGKAWDGADIVAKQKRNYSKDSFVDGGKVRKRSKTSTPLSQVAGEYDLSVSGNLAFQKWTEAWACEALRVLKPGAHAIIFCGPRTYHRMATGVEDAGFEIRDQLQWLFGSGFPKSLDISKAVDKCFGAKREVVENGERSEIRPVVSDQPRGKAYRLGPDASITSPTSSAAKQWDGWGTALKPANEPIVLARKPLSKKNVAQNVLKWGTGGLNIDGSRIEHNVKTVFTNRTAPTPAGRFPSNLLLDEEAARMLDEQTGELKTNPGTYRRKSRDGDGNTFRLESQGTTSLGDSGGASRFFYVAKTSKWERNYGLETEEIVTTDGRKKPIDNPYLRGETTRQNSHPTVKPFTLMRYLVRLITPPGGIVLDPFLGSGTTGAVAVACGFRFIGIEKEPQYMEIATKRIEDVKLGNIEE